VGDGPLRRTLERAHPDLFFTGMLTGEPLAAHFASADVFLFPSETETFGNVTLEALSSGLFVVAFDYAAARAHVRPGATGVLAPLGDPATFVAAAAGLAERPGRVHEVREDVGGSVSHLDWARVVDRFEALLAGVTRASRNAGPLGAGGGRER